MSLSIAEQGLMDKLKEDVVEVSGVPKELNRFMSYVDEKVTDFDRRLKSLEKQHQAVLDNLKKKSKK